MEALLSHLLTAPPQGEVSTVDDWWTLHRACADAWRVPVDRAMAAAVRMDRLGWAFASGYQEALRHLVPGLPPEAKVALCATEAGGNHPRAIQTRLVVDGDGWQLRGEKSFTTLGPCADLLLVVARDARGGTEEADPSGRVRLAVVRVPSARSGVHVSSMPALGFVPEVPHGQTRFDDVAVHADERLGGDGYADHLKPFRTVEDVHVHAALLAWLLGTARRLDWPRAIRERLLAAVATARALAPAPANDASVHLALAGLLAQTQETVQATEPCWDDAPPALRDRWRRDRALLRVAAGARDRRSESAWHRLG